MIYRPVRERDPDEIVDTLISAIEKGGYDEASVTSLSTADYSCISPLIKKLMDKLRDRRVSLGISSLRAYGLSDELLDEIASVKATGLTFAPEAGTQRMRDVINKNISEDDILTTCHRVFSKGWSRMKLYFMIGLPGEEDEDVAGIAELGREARRIGRSYTNRASVTVSVSSHVPKPHTPFQWVAMDRPEEIRRKQEILFHKTRDYRLTFRRHDMRISHLEGIVSRGDQRVGALIRRAWEAGAHFDGWDDQLRFDVWQEALKTWEAEEGISRDLFLGTIPVDAQLPWDHIDVGLEEGFLKREYKKSMKGRLSPPCGKPAGAKVHHTNLQDAHADERRLVCYHCGIACDLAGMKDARVRRLEQLGAEAPLQPSEKNARENALDRVKQGLTPHSFNQAHKVKFRLRYTKLGAVHLQGHLDMVRIIPRVFRRAGIDVFYSEGFSPKPVMSFGPALGLGAHSVAEYVDIALAADLTAAEVLDRIRAVAPEGMAFTGVRRLKQGDRKLSKVIQAIEYVMAAPPALQADDGLATLQERLNARWQSSDPIVLDVIRKKKPRQVDLRDVVISADAEIEPRYARLTGLPETQLALRIRQRFGGLSLKPVEVSAALTGEGDEPAAILRTGCWHVDGEQWIDPLVADDPDADRVAVAPLD